jgi:hypothetical protein
MEQEAAPPPPLPGFVRAEKLGSGKFGTAYRELDTARNEWVAVKYVSRYSVRAPRRACLRGVCPVLRLRPAR